MRALFPRHAWRVVIAIGLGLTCISSARAENAPPSLPDFTPVSWLPVMLPALAKIPMAAEGISLATDRSCIQKEDAATLLVQSTDGKTLRQWAVALIIFPRKPEEKQYNSPAQTYYLDTGSKIAFRSTLREGMPIHVIGPFSEIKGAAKAKDVWSGALIDTQFLGLGLDSIPAFLRRMKQKCEDKPALNGKAFSIHAGSTPFSPEQIARNKILMEPFDVTAAEERSFAGCSPALMDFFGIAIQTPGVKDILQEAVDIPWLKIIAHGGRVEVNFELLPPFEKLSASDWGLPPEMQVYSMGLRVMLFDQPALLCRLAVTSPRPPLLNCAGIIGLAAMRPNGQGPHMMMRIMAARAAPTPPVP